MKSHFRMPANAGACPENIVQGERYRITVLTPGLLRLEYSPEGLFEDRPTRMVLRRDFPKTDFRVVRRGKTLEIHTGRLHLVYDGAPFSRNGLSVSVKGGLYEISQRLALRRGGDGFGRHRPHPGHGGRSRPPGPRRGIPERLFRAGRQRFPYSHRGRLGSSPEPGGRGFVFLGLRT